jgi:hypothetical protein
MKQPRNYLPRDLKALRYLDALQAGDLKVVAALWEEASRDPQLERVLAELDGALFVEDAVANGKPDAERGRRDMRKHLPGGFRSQRPLTTLRRSVGVVGGLAAAGVVALFIWPGRDGKNPVASPPTNESAHQVAPQPPVTNDRIASWRQYRRVLDGEEMPTFTWPLQGDVAQLGINLDSSRPARLKEPYRPL